MRATGTTIVLAGLMVAGVASSSTVWGEEIPTPSGPTLTLTPNSGLAGDQVRYTSNCSNGTLTWIDNRETRSAGVSGSVTVPSGFSPGRHDITLNCPALELSADATATFTVTAPKVTPDPTTPTTAKPTDQGTLPSTTPSAPTTTVAQSPATVRLSAGSAEPGDAVTATGRNFTENCPPRRMSLLVDGNLVTPIGTSGSAGAPSVAFAVPDLSAGPVRVRLSCTDGPSAFAALQVLDPPRIPTTSPPPTDTVTPTSTGEPTPTRTIAVVPGPITSPPGPVPPAPEPAPAVSRSEFARSVPTPYELDWTLPAILTSLVLAGFLFWALGFPSEPFNKTLEEKRDEVRTWFAARRDPRGEHTGRADHQSATSSDEEPRRAGSRIISGWWGFPLWCALAAVLLSLVEPGTSLAPSEWVPVPPLAVGFLIAVPVTTLFYALPAEMYVRGTGGGGAALRFLPGALLFAAICLGLSRWVHLEPGYIYGVFAFYAATQRAGAREEEAGRGVLFGSLWLLAVSVAAWFAWPLVIPAASAADPGYWVLVADCTLVAIFVLGMQTLVFGLIPLEFLDGHKLKTWKGPIWAAVWACSIALFVHVLLGKFVKEVRDPTVAVVAASAFLAFGALSAGFWLASRFGLRASSEHGGTTVPDRDRRVRDTGRTTPRMAIGIAGALLIVVVPVTVLVAGLIWSESASAGVARYAATVDVDALRVRVAPSTGGPQVDVLPRGRAVDIRCAVTTPNETWYQLLNPNVGNYVSGIGLSFSDGSGPPPC